MAVDSLKKTTLPSGLVVEIRALSIDDMDECKDTINVLFKDGAPSGVTNVNKGRTLWLRKGLCAIGDWKSTNGECPPDSVLIQLDDEDRIKASDLIQEAQSVSKKKPSHSRSMS